MPDHAQPLPDLALAQALGADLDAADFRSDPLRLLWGEEQDDALARGLREPILRAIDGQSGAAATLGRLFVLGMAQPRDAVQRALPRVGVDGLLALGLATIERDESHDGDERDESHHGDAGGVVVPKAIIRPQSFVDVDGVGEWWIASDLDEVALGTALPADHVLGVGGASRTLAELVIPAPVERALDLGTGCGIQALLVSRHAQVVIATDISDRALAYAELNAQLNGVRNIQFRAGSMFEPVVGEAFDLIVSNPPFVITPRATGMPEYEYRDGGLVGDALVEQFLRSAPAHLRPGGVAQLLGNWESRGGAAGLDRVRSWVGEDLDVWVVQREELSPLAYAELWIRDGGTLPRDAGFTLLLTAWLDDFAARGVTAIGFGYILLRRPAYIPGADTPHVGPIRGERPASGVSAPQMGGSADQAVAPTGRLRRFETVSQPVSNLGRALGAGLAAHEALLDGIPDRLLIAADVTEARHHLPGDGDPSVIELRQGGGFARTIGVDSALAGFVGACDGELSVSQIVSALADLFEVPVADLWADLEARIRRLMLDGFLLPADDAE